MKFDAGDVYRNLLCDLEFPEHLRSVTHRGLKFPSVLSTFIVRFGWYSRFIWYCWAVWLLWQSA